MPCSRCLLALAIGCLASCSDPEHIGRISDLTKKIEKRVEASEISAIASPSELRISQTPYLGKVGSSHERASRLPAEFDRENFTLLTDAPLEPEEVAQRISEATNVPVHLDLDPGYATSASLNGFGGSVHRYAGSLSRFLDQLAVLWDAEWRHRSGIVLIRNAIPKAYQIEASAATSAVGFLTTDGSAESGQMSTEFSISSELWEEVNASLVELVNPGTMNISRSTGLVSVVAPPSVHQRVQDYVDRANSTFGARITLEIVAAFLNVDGLDSQGLSLNLLRKATDGDTSIEIGTDFSSATGSIASFRVLPDASGGAAQYADARVLIQALSRSGRLVDVRTASAITRHGSPVPIRLARKRDIVRSIEVVATADIQTTSIESETLNTG